MNTEIDSRTYSAGTINAELINADPRIIGAMTTDELREELARGLTLVAENLFRTGQIWIELERRGEDLSDLRKGLAVYLPMIGTGRVDARTVVKFAGAPTLLRAVSLLPIEEQIRLSQGGTVPLVLEDCSLVPTEPLRLTAPQIAQVFNGGQIRSTAEQKEIIKRRQNKVIKKIAVKYDREKGRFLIGRQVVGLHQIIAAMTNAEPPAKGRAKEKLATVEVKLPESVMLALKLSATDTGKPFADALLSVMRLAGMID